MRGDTEKNQNNFSIEPISANPRIVLCNLVYRRCNWLIFLRILKAFQNELIDFCSVAA